MGTQHAPWQRLANEKGTRRPGQPARPEGTWLHGRDREVAVVRNQGIFFLNIEIIHLRTR